MHKKRASLSSQIRCQTWRRRRHDRYTCGCWWNSWLVFVWWSRWWMKLEPSGSTFSDLDEKWWWWQDREVSHLSLHLCPPPPPERGFQPDHLQCSCFPVSLCSSSGIVHLTPYAWQLSEEDNPIDTTRNVGICSTFDTRFISSTYWAELTTQQRDRHQRGGWVGGGPTLWRLNLTSGLRPIMQQVSGQLPKWVWFFLLKTPHPSAEFLLLQSSPWLPEALLFTDTCSVTLIPPMTPIHI